MCHHLLVFTLTYEILDKRLSDHHVSIYALASGLNVGGSAAQPC